MRCTFHLLPSRHSFPKAACFRSVQHGRLNFISAPISTARSQLQYEFIEDVERLDGYVKGGYHPVLIGDIFQNRYKIVHKLGFGGHSTIWLARDQQRHRYVAVKICMATAPSNGEMELLRLISNQTPCPQLPGLVRHLTPPILDLFEHNGPNGTHKCIVTAPAMCSLADSAMASDFEPFPLDAARSLAAQLVIAVAHLHTSGIVHGDLHLGNLLLHLPTGIDDLEEQQLYDHYDPPIPEAVVRIDKQPVECSSVPQHVYEPIWLGKPGNEIATPDAKLLLSDFGTAFRPAEEDRVESFTPLEIRPPETMFEPRAPLTFSSDIWSLGCVIWAILSVRPLLGHWLFGTDSAIEMQIRALGPLPEAWWEKWRSEVKTETFESNGVLKARNEVKTLDKRFEDSIQQPRREGGTEVMGQDEKAALLEMVQSVLRFEPHKRLSALQIMETEWMKRWAIPAAERSWGGIT